MRIDFTFFAMISCVDAFARTGHYLIGSAIQQLLTPEAQSGINKCGLLAEFDGDLGAASTWADSIKGKPAYRWTSRMHYGAPNSTDYPPETCLSYKVPVSVIKPSDIHSALFHYNQKINILHRKGSCDYRFSFLMYLHLLQDLFQPLHHCPRDRGGNEADRIYDGKKTNLHKMWDLDIVNTFLKVRFDGNVTMAIEYYVRALKEESCDISFVDVHPNSTNWVGLLNKVHDHNCMFIWDEDINDTYRNTSVAVIGSLFAQSIYVSSCLFNSLFT